MKPRYPGESKHSEDPFFIYYVMKICDLMYVKSSIKVSMLGREHNTIPLMEFLSLEKDKRESQEFWHSYYTMGITFF